MQWVTTSNVAADDKLGVRCAGRPEIRPWPCEDSSKQSFKVGVAIDVWQCDHWREGVVTGFVTSSADSLPVYFPDTY